MEKNEFMEKNVFKWQFGTCNCINVYKNNSVSTHVQFNYNTKRKIKVVYTIEYLSKDDWKQILTCIKEAKEILKKVNRL